MTSTKINKIMVSSNRQQSGAVLIVSLILLLVLTMGVLSANRDVVVQEKATAAVRESNIVFQVAESALIEAESTIDSLDLTKFVAAGTDGLYAEGKAPSNYLSNDAWKDAVTTTATEVEGGYSAKYFIEYMGQMAFEPEEISLEVKNSYHQQDALLMVDVFRVVVRAEGDDGTPVRLVSGYFRN